GQRIRKRMSAIWANESRRKLLTVLGVFAGVALLLSPTFMPASCCIALFGGDWNVEQAAIIGDYVVVDLDDTSGDNAIYLIAVIDTDTGEIVARESSRWALRLEGRGEDYVWIRESGEYPVALKIPSLEPMYELEDVFDDEPQLESLIEQIRFD